MLDTFIRTPYNYNMDEASKESGLLCEDPSRAMQNGKEESDINTLVKRFGITGQLPVNVRAPTYGDYTGVDNYHEALNAIALANEAFEEMPADIRKRFNNDPGLFVDFCSDPANRDEAAKLGLVHAQAVDLAASQPTAPAVPAASPSTPST